MKTYQHFINGSFVDPEGGAWFETENPYLGTPWAKIPRGSARDVNKAVAAA
jgi:acyl-CoA reductase-like NAD-dependent aldehyde dehydrogenase